MIPSNNPLLFYGAMLPGCTNSADEAIQEDFKKQFLCHLFLNIMIVRIYFLPVLSMSLSRDKECSKQSD
jgi:hypothetical protein